MDGPTRDEATAALDELAAARRAVASEGTRGLPALLGAWSALQLIDYAAKDHLPDRRAQRLVSVVCAAATLGLGLADHRSRPVQPISVDPADFTPRGSARMVAAIAGWAVAERLMVHGLRRSRLRHPNTAAGLALAVLRPAAYVATMKLAPRPRNHG
jgi:hypothetical protein